MNLAFLFSFKSPDIIVDSSLSYYWTRFMIEKIQTLIKNHKLPNPLSRRIHDDIIISEPTKKMIPDHSKSLFSKIDELTNLNLQNLQTVVRIEEMSYKVQGLYTNLKSSERFHSGHELDLEIGASQIRADFKKITLSLEIPVTNEKKVKASIFLHHPFIQINGGNFLSFHSKILMIKNQRSFNFQFLEQDFNDFSKQLRNHFHFSLGELEFSTLSLTIGSKTISLNEKMLKKIIQDKKEDLKTLLVSKLVDFLKRDSRKFCQMIPALEIQKEHWLQTDSILGQFIVEDIQLNHNTGNTSLNLSGNFCLNKDFDAQKNKCVTQSQMPSLDNRLTPALHEDSLTSIERLRSFDDAELMMSVSENYINKLLLSTYQAGFWNDALQDAGVSLGDKKMLLRFDKEGRTGTLYLDVIYHNSRSEQFFLGSDVIHFPVVMDISAKIKKNNQGIPSFNIYFEDVNLSDNILLNGVSSLGFPSNLRSFKLLRKPVLNKIRASLESLVGQKLSLDFPEFKNLGLEDVVFQSDGLGRMNAFVN